MNSNYDKFREMLPAVAAILDLSKATEDLKAVKDIGYEEDFDGAYTGKLFFEMNDEQINDAVEEIFEALVPGGLMYALFKEGVQIGEYINEDAGFDVIEVLENGVICKKKEVGSMNIFSMMC